MLINTNITLLLVLLLLSSLAPASPLLLPPPPSRVPPPSSLRSTPSSNDPSATDTSVIIIGGGIGGLCAGALLTAHNISVTLIESHNHLGGVAHAFPRKTKAGTYLLDSGPSLWAGCSVPSTNPLRQVLDACQVGSGVDSIEWVTYDGWGCHDLPLNASFRMTTGPSSLAFDAVVEEHGGAGEVESWNRLLEDITPVVDAAMSCPPMALSSDAPNFVRRALLPYLLPSILATSLRLRSFVPNFLTGPSSLLFSLTPVKPPTSSFTFRWLDYLAFAISGLPASGTVGAALAYTLGDLYRPGAFLDYPVGGSGRVAAELAGVIERAAGGRVLTSRHVEEIIVENGRAEGVRLRGGEVVRAGKAVISNADIWNTAKMLPKMLQDDSSGRSADAEKMAKTIPTPSFVHLWVGFDATGLPPDLDCHHSVFNEGLLGPTAAPIDAPRNFHIISIPTLFDPTLAPPGKHLAHVYAAATEPYEDWEGMDRNGPAYKRKKEEAADVLWRSLEAVIPDVRERASAERMGGDGEVLVEVGTPLTHERFNRRYKGSYGPGGGTEMGDLKGFRNGKVEGVEGLFTVGDSNFPGIGVPAVAASAILVVNEIAGGEKQGAMLREMKERGVLKGGKGWWKEAREEGEGRRRGNGGRIKVEEGLDALGTRKKE